MLYCVTLDMEYWVTLDILRSLVFHWHTQGDTMTNEEILELIRIADEKEKKGKLTKLGIKKK